MYKTPPINYLLGGKRGATPVTKNSFPKESHTFLTERGLSLDPLKLKESDVDIYDIARALSHQCRFGGRVRQTYTVATHSLNMVNWTDDPKIQMLALLHDATEAYITDIPKPYKHALYLKIDDKLLSFEEYEEHLLQTILAGLECSHIYTDSNWKKVRELDLRALEIEFELVAGLWTTISSENDEEPPTPIKYVHSHHVSDFVFVTDSPINTAKQFVSTFFSLHSLINE